MRRGDGGAAKVETLAAAGHGVGVWSVIAWGNGEVELLLPPRSKKRSVRWSIRGGDGARDGAAAVERETRERERSQRERWIERRGGIRIFLV